MNLTLDNIKSSFLFFCIIMVTGLTIYIVSNPPPSEMFTEFYVLGPSGKASLLEKVEL